jgi:hypothetical protein
VVNHLRFGCLHSREIEQVDASGHVQKVQPDVEQEHKFEVALDPPAAIPTLARKSLFTGVDEEQQPNKEVNGAP